MRVRLCQNLDRSSRQLKGHIVALHWLLSGHSLKQSTSLFHKMDKSEWSFASGKRCSER